MRQDFKILHEIKLRKKVGFDQSKRFSGSVRIMLLKPSSPDLDVEVLTAPQPTALAQ